MPANGKVKLKANEIDTHVGKNLKTYRSMAGMSQSELAKQSGITFQQIQKYENGTNRISASRMYALACILDINVAHFFKGLDDTGDSFPEMDKETLNVISLYQKISDKRIKKSLLTLLKSYVKKS